jgi:hypothetical protein
VKLESLSPSMCRALFGSSDSPRWIGGSELSTIIWLLPFWVFFGVMIWKWLGQSLDRPERQAEPSKETEAHDRRDGEDKHTNANNTDQHCEPAGNLVEDGMHLDGTMLHQPCHGDVQGDGGGYQGRRNRSALPEGGARGVLNDGGDTDRADPVAICGDSIHKRGSESESSFLPNVKGVARRRMDVQSEANEGRYPPLPLPSCSAL